MKISFAAILAAAVAATCAQPIMAVSNAGNIMNDTPGTSNCWYVKGDSSIGLKTCKYDDPDQNFDFNSVTKQITHNNKCVDEISNGVIRMADCDSQNAKQVWIFNDGTQNQNQIFTFSPNNHLHHDDDNSNCITAQSDGTIAAVPCVGSAKGANPELEHVFLGPTSAPSAGPTSGPTSAPTAPPVTPVTGSSSGDPHCKCSMLVLATIDLCH